MKRLWPKTIQGVVLAAVLAGAGCSGGINPTGEAVTDLAATIADPTNGIYQEITDIGAYVFGSLAGKSMSFRDSLVLYMRDRLEDGSFTWNPASSSYELTEAAIPISAGDVSGTISNLELAVTFLTSSDATGTGVQLTDPAAGLDSAAGTVRSLRYHRLISGTLTNSRSGVTRDFSALTDLTAGWHDGTSLGVNGTHSRSFTHSFPDGRTAVGTLSLEVSNLQASWGQLGDFSDFIMADGAVPGVYDAAVDRLDGSSQSLTRAGLVEFDRSENAIVSVIGMSVRVSLLGGGF